MGIVDIITALGKVAAERSQEQPSSITGTNMPMPGYQDMAPPASLKSAQGVGGFISDVIRESRGDMTSLAANKIGFPETAGLNREQIADMLKLQQQPAVVRKLNAEATDEEASAKQRLSKAKQMERYESMRQEPDFASAQVSLLTKIKENPIMALRAQDPQVYNEMLANELDAVKAVKSGKVQTTAQKEKAAGKAVPAAGGVDLSKAVKRADGKILVKRNGQKGYISPDKFNKQTDVLAE